VKADTETISVFAKEPNCWIVQVPGRKNPGAIIQLDSLRILHNRISELAERLETDGASEETSELALEIRDVLQAYMNVAEEALKGAGVPAPWE
jgi:hypothetical protein